MDDNTPEIDDEPLEFPPKTLSFPQISDEMVASIALGMEDELVVASRHGMSVETYELLARQPWFQLQVAAKRSEFEKNGVTFRAKAAWMAGDLLEKVYSQVMANEASLNQQHDVLKTLIKAGGLEPREDRNGPAGPGFQINIDLGGGQSVSLISTPSRTPITMDADVKEISSD